MVRTFSIQLLLLFCVFMVEVGCDVTDNIDDLENKTTKSNPDDELNESHSLQVIINGSFQYSEKGKVRNVLDAGKLERFENNDIWHVDEGFTLYIAGDKICLLYTSPSPRDRTRSRMPSSA